MELIKGKTYDLIFEDIGGKESFTGIYTGTNKNGSHTFKNSRNGRKLIVGREDIVELKKQSNRTF